MTSPHGSEHLITTTVNGEEGALSPSGHGQNLVTASPFQWDQEEQITANTL